MTRQPGGDGSIAMAVQEVNVDLVAPHDVIPRRNEVVCVEVRHDDRVDEVEGKTECIKPADDEPRRETAVDQQTSIARRAAAPQERAVSARAAAEHAE